MLSLSYKNKGDVNLIKFYLTISGADFFTLFVFLVPRDCCVALPHDAMGLSAVCNCGIS